MHRFRLLALALTLVALLALRPTIAHGETGTTYRDPFAYCAAVGTIDTPDERYVGPKVPKSVAKGLREALGLPITAPLRPLARSTSWRCMEGHVYACTVGANLPCWAKADVSRVPSQAMSAYCQQNPTADFIPAYITGRETVYAWRCRAGHAVVDRQLTQPDARGFLSNIWYKIAKK